MWTIIAYSNYECTEGPEDIIGKYESFEEAIDIFFKLSQDPNAIDFQVLDDYIDEWVKLPGWEDDIYHGGYYSGRLVLYEEEIKGSKREILVAYRSRNPKSKELTCEIPESGEDITPEEKRELVPYAEFLE